MELVKYDNEMPKGQDNAADLASEKHRDLLDIIDTLRSWGVSHYVDLPQIIVCGSQSSGKSSTLESISGIAFPTSEGLCTRFATELILRKSETTEIRVHINPGAGRSEEEKARLARFAPSTSDIGDVPKIIEAAKEVMGLAGDSAKIFSNDVLRIESLSPSQPNLTIVDLPGLFGAADKNQSDDDAKMVQDLVTSYMRQRRSIILAVVTADNPFTNQPVTKFAREIDPQGLRTLGLITKPDKLDHGSESQRYYVEMAQNQNVKLKLGWHVLRNRSFETGSDTAEERDAREADFFAQLPWCDLDPKQLGVQPLKARLRDVLWHQIRMSLPGVKSDVQTGIQDCRAKLGQLGKARTSSREKHTYLNRISARLTILVRAAIDGVYADQIFESYPGQPDVLERRLRANVQGILHVYSLKMRKDGHALEVVEEYDEPVRRSSAKFIMRSTYLDVVKDCMVECKGRELPGTFNPMVVGDLFSRQCKPWENITKNLVEEIHEAAARTFNTLVSEITDLNTKARLMRHIQKALYMLREDLKAKVGELLMPHLMVHPITYNNQLTERVQNIQYTRHKKRFDDAAEEACGYTTDSAPKSHKDTLFNLATLLNSLLETTAPDVENDSASLAADVAAAYYEVALKKFIDDVSVNAVETCLVQRLPDVFSPEVVWDLDDAAVQQLGSENEATIRERADLTEKLNVLEAGLRDLDAFTARGGS
ncbi:P-loop containing nucleoside triphosphate hydrolase protein [Xylariaceae sp. FL0804]|nr:P-loop containing nucleoside triphosphate hydrolase protein [Xylariaceae sp. FL0804]